MISVWYQLNNQPVYHLKEFKSEVEAQRWILGQAEVTAHRITKESWAFETRLVKVGE